MPLRHGPLVDEHLGVEVSDQAELCRELARAWVASGLRHGLPWAVRRGILGERATLDVFASQQRDGAEAAVGNWTIPSREHLLLKGLIEMEQVHDLGHASSCYPKTLGDCGLGSKDLGVELGAVLPGAVEPQSPTLELSSIDVVVARLGIVGQFQLARNHSEIEHEQLVVDLLHARGHDALGDLGHQLLSCGVVLTARDLGKGRARKALCVAVVLGAPRCGQEVELAAGETRHGASGTHRTVEGDGDALGPWLPLDVFDQRTHGFGILHMPWEGRPTQRVAAVIAEKENADLEPVPEALLGATALGEVWPPSLEPGIRQVREQGNEGAITLLVPTNQSLLEVGLDMVELVEDTMDPRVVRLRGSNAQELRQGRARKPALGVELGPRGNTALNREGANDRSRPHSHLGLRDQSLQELGELPGAPKLERDCDVEVSQVGEDPGLPLGRLGKHEALLAPGSSQGNSQILNLLIGELPQVGDNSVGWHTIISPVALDELRVAPGGVAALGVDEPEVHSCVYARVTSTVLLEPQHRHKLPSPVSTDASGAIRFAQSERSLIFFGQRSGDQDGVNRLRHLGQSTSPAPCHGSPSSLARTFSMT